MNSSSNTSNSGKNSNTEKLQKVLARAGLGSRREMEAAISDGRVKVNGEVAKLGDRIASRDRVAFDDRLVTLRDDAEVSRRVIMYNKPEGELCTRKDPEGRRTVFDRLPRLKGERWIAIGRLDINTSGLLLFTTDGELANRLMHPSTQVEREYAVRVMGQVKREHVVAMVEGVMLEDGPARFTDVQEFGGEGINTWFHVVIMEGRNREVRRLWESQGLTVSRLKRVRYGNIFLDKRAKAGEWTELTQSEIDDLSTVAGLDPAQGAEPDPGRAEPLEPRQEQAPPGTRDAQAQGLAAFALSADSTTKGIARKGRCR